MESNVRIEYLKKLLRQEVALFCERDSRQWKSPVIEMLRDLHATESKAVFFGGTLRSLLISRLFENRPGRPRDVDIVVSGTSLDVVRDRFPERVTRETRFGGLQLRHKNWQFDVWPLARTWAFVNDAVAKPEFRNLPQTTFFNLEAIAVDVWASPGRPRELYSGNDQFFEGVIQRTLEVNFEKNPFPELCVVRAFVMASSLDFQIGPRLAAYVVNHGERLTIGDLELVQIKHYGAVRHSGEILKRWMSHLSKSLCRSETSAVRLPLSRPKHPPLQEATR